MADHLRILILAHYYPPEMGGAAARLHGLARWLTTFGHQVTVLAGMPNYPSGVIFPEHQRRLLAREKMDDVDVIRSWVYASSQRRPVSRLLNYLSFVASSIINGLIHIRQVDVIIASSPPLFIGLAGWFLAKWYQAPWVLDVRDVWPDIAVEVGAFSPYSAFVRWMNRLARLLYRHATHITHVTQNQSLKLIHAGVPGAKLTLVPNGVDVDYLSNAPKKDWRTQLGLVDRFVVVYAGLIGVAQGVEIVTDTALKLRDHLEIHFLIVGDGVRKPEIVQTAEELGLTNITFLSRQPHDVIPSILSSADVAWVPLVSDQIADARPSKLLEAWACKKPVILSASGEAANLVEISGGGLVIPPGQPQRLADAILATMADNAAIQTYGDRGYQFVNDKFDRQKFARQMEQVLYDVVQQKA